MTLDSLWLLQTLVALGSAIVLLIVGLWLAIRDDEPVERLDALVGIAGLFLIALGNVATSWGAAIIPNWADLRDAAGTMIRGTLLTLAIYFVGVGPLRMRVRWRERRARDEKEERNGRDG